MVKKMIQNRDFFVKVTMGSDIVAPMSINECKVEIDNTRCKDAVTQIRLTLKRSVSSVFKDKFHPVEDVVATAISSGGPAY